MLCACVVCQVLALGDDKLPPNGRGHSHVTLFPILVKHLLNALMLEAPTARWSS